MSTAKCWNFCHIGVAPSSASGCKECGEKILKGDIRLGQEYYSRHGGRGAVAWRHLACIGPRGVTSGVNAQGYKVPLVPSEARLPLLVGWESLSGEQQAAVRAVCHAKTQGANATPKPAARPDPMAWAPPATTSKVANGKKRKLEPSPTGPPQPQLPLPIVAGYVVEPPPQPLPLPVVEGYILVVD